MSGIGLALAQRLAREGWRLTLVARHPGRLAAAVEALSAQGGTATAYSADVADAAAVAEAVAAQGALDLVVACAGIVTPKRLDEQPLETFHRTMAGWPGPRE